MITDKKCDFCDRKATYDGKTLFGYWAYMCVVCCDRFWIRNKGLLTKLDKGGSKNGN